MNLLFITEISPYPVTRGERIRSYGLLNIFKSLKYNTIAIIGKTEKLEELKSKFKNITFIEYNFNKLYEAGRWLFNFLIFKKDKELIHLINPILNNNRIDIVFIDYKYYGQYISFFKKKNIPVIYGTHNVQSRIGLQRITLNLRNRIINYFEYLILVFHEKYYFRKTDKIIAVSEDDFKYYKKYISENKISVIPNFVNEEEYNLKDIKKQDYIIMSGNFHTYQNIAGLKWFLENVWDEELSEKIKLKVVGSNSDNIIKELNAENQYKNIEATGPVDNLKPLIAKAKAAIVPILHGSGTRLKCIEAMALKTQLISTSKGCEGIQHENSIIIADEPEKIKSEIINILSNQKDYTKKAYQIFKDRYSMEVNQKIFKSVVDSLITK